MTEQLPDWITDGAVVAILIPRRGQWPVVDTGKVKAITVETVVVRTADTTYRFRRPALALWGATAQHSPVLVPLTDAHVIAADIRAKVRKAGKTLVALADDVRYGMEADDVADLLAGMLSLRDQLTDAIASLSEQLP